MTVNVTAGSAIFIAYDTVADTPLFQAPTSLAEYLAIGVDPAINEWRLVGEVEDLGDFGDEAGTTEFTAVDNRRVRKFKTTFDAGTIDITVGDDTTDDGQNAMLEALASDFNVPFRVDLSDQLTNGGSPTQVFNHGIVTGNRRTLGTVDNIVKKAIPVALNGDFFEVAAT